MNRLISSLALASLAFALTASPARAGDPVIFPATSWAGQALVSVQIPSVGKVPGVLEAELYFGPLGSPSLGVNEFLLVFDDGVETFEIEGSYALDAKGTPVLTADLGALETQTIDLLIHVCEDVLLLGSDCDLLDAADLVFDPSKVKFKVKGKSKGGFAAAQAAGKIPFLLTAPGESFKVSLSFKSVVMQP
jgi:hypothetical protein